MRTSTNLDMLRALAVSYVVLDHSLEFFGNHWISAENISWLGRLGVMFFFVHTCLVLMMSLERQIGKFSGSAFVANFYLRRIFRIYPLSIFMIAIVLFFAIPSERIAAPFTLARMIPTHLQLASNLFLFQNLFHSKRSIIGVLWSLPYEVQMYAFLPFLFLYLARKGKLAWLLALWVFSIGLAYVIHPLYFVPHFLPGVIAYVVMQRVKKPRIPATAWPAFLLLLTAAFYAPKPSYPVGFVICLILGLCLPFFTDVRSSAVNWVTHHVAKYSYGIYLAHLLCMWIAYNYLPLHSPVVKAVTFTVLLVSLPFLLFHAIEDPMIRVGSRIGDRYFRTRPEQQPVLQAKMEELEETTS